MLLDIADQDEIQKEQGTAAAFEMKRQVSGVLDGMLREMDFLFADKVFGIILPETSLDGAMAVSRRIIDSVARKVRVGLHVGVAEFGVDAFTDAELYQAAETALQLAEKTDKAVIQYAQVRSATDDLDESIERAVSMN
jgi:GGDEF domain-containing protein